MFLVTDYCPECNTPTSEDSVLCPKCGFRFEILTLIICQNCNTENDMMANFCNECGNKVEPFDGFFGDDVNTVEEPVEICDKMTDEQTTMHLMTLFHFVSEGLQSSDESKNYIKENLLNTDILNRMLMMVKNNVNEYTTHSPDKFEYDWLVNALQMREHERSFMTCFLCGDTRVRRFLSNQYAMLINYDLSRDVHHPWLQSLAAVVMADTCFYNTIDFMIHVLANEKSDISAQDKVNLYLLPVANYLHNRNGYTTYDGSDMGMSIICNNLPKLDAKPTDHAFAEIKQWITIDDCYGLLRLNAIYRYQEIKEFVIDVLNDKNAPNSRRIEAVQVLGIHGSDEGYGIIKKVAKMFSGYPKSVRTEAKEWL